MSDAEIVPVIGAPEKAAELEGEAKRARVCSGENVFAFSCRSVGRD